jgi:hypothetical protein
MGYIIDMDIKPLGFIFFSFIYLAPVLIGIRHHLKKYKSKLTTARHIFLFTTTVGFCIYLYLLFLFLIIELLPIDNFFAAIIFHLQLVNLYLTFISLVILAICWIALWTKKIFCKRT